MFVNRRYFLMNLEDRTVLTREARELSDLAADLAQENILPRKLYTTHERLCLALLQASEDDFPIG